MRAQRNGWALSYQRTPLFSGVLCILGERLSEAITHEIMVTHWTDTYLYDDLILYTSSIEFAM